MPGRFYRRRWNESRGDEFDGWGPATYYFEVGDDGWPVRQIEVYDDGPVLRYGPGHDEDQYGFLGQVSLDELGDWNRFAIQPEQFEAVWRAAAP
jgi:hypothetical protein